MSGEKQYQREYLFFNDNRTKNQRELTTQLANTLSEINILRVQQHKQSTNELYNQLRKEDFLYVCLTGVPPFKDQFKELDLPGEILQFRYILTQEEMTQQQAMSPSALLSGQAKILHQKINNCSEKKRLVFVFHSFGSYIATTYFHLFSHDRIVGLIDIGAAPIRFYPYLKKMIKEVQQTEWQYIKQNIDAIYQNYKQQCKKIGLLTYPTKYHLMASHRILKESNDFKQMFKMNRNWPKVLKCFIYGRKDLIFPADLLNQKAIFYCYKNRISPEAQDNLTLAFTKITGQKVRNIQQRYIFNIQQGFHSVHMQKKHTNLIKQVIKEYICLIQLVCNIKAKI